MLELFSSFLYIILYPFEAFIGTLGDYISAIQRHAFLRHAVLAGMLIGIIAPVIGVFLVVRRLSMIADALSHVTLTGIAFHMLLGKYFLFMASLNPVFTGMLFSVLGSLGIERLRKVYKHYQELAIPIMLSTGVAFGVVFISMANGFNVDLFNYLFGSIIAIRFSDFVTISIVSIIVFVVIILFYKELFSISFDEEFARVSGLKRRLLNIVFIILVAIVIASSMRIVGILLVSALMVLPVAASIRIANSFKQTFFYAILFGQLSVSVGLFLSYAFNLAPGGTIVVLAFLILLGTITIQKVRKRKQELKLVV